MKEKMTVVLPERAALTKTGSWTTCPTNHELPGVWWLRLRSVYWLCLGSIWETLRYMRELSYCLTSYIAPDVVDS